MICVRSTLCPLALRSILSYTDSQGRAGRDVTGVLSTLRARKAKRQSERISREGPCSSTDDHPTSDRHKGMFNILRIPAS